MTSAPRPAGDRILRLGAIITVIGLGFSAIAMLPLVIPDLTLPSFWWFLSMTFGVGLAMVILGLFMSARARRRASGPRGGTSR